MRRGAPATAAGPWRGWLAAPVAALLLAAAPARAQDLEPRAYANTPVGMNFLVAGYTYSSGGVATDASLPLEDAKIDLHMGIFAYAHSFGLLGRSAKFDLVVPVAGLEGTARLDGVEVERVVEGFADPRLRVSVNWLGSPAMDLEHWRAWKQDWIAGASIQVGVPVGQYDPDRLVNLGTNRWFFKPELAVSKAWGPFVGEVQAAATLYTDNDDFAGERTRSQDALWSLQGHAICSLPWSSWVALDLTWYGGGGTKVDGVARDDELSNVRAGATLALPLSRRFSIKLYGSSSIEHRAGTDFDTVGMALQARWGPGLEE